MTESLENFNREEHKGVTLTWDNIQKEFECCGVNNFTDWEGTPAFNETNDVPDSCCKNITLGCGKGASDTEKIYNTGCFVKFEGFIVDNVATVGGVGIGVVILLFLGICVSCYIARGLNSKRSHGRLPY
jgi:CD63 antigen